MDKKTALDFFNTLHFMPGWSFDAFALSESMLAVQAGIETVNSNRDQALQGYPQHVVLGRRAMIYLDEYETEDDLAEAVFAWLYEILTHEAREFLRVGPDMRAPFHPHRPEGERAWSDLLNNPRDPKRGLVMLDV